MMDEQVEIVEEKPDKDKYWKLTRDCLLEGTLYLCVLLMTVFFFLLLKPFTSFYHVGAFAKTFIALVFAGCGVFIAYMGVTKRLKARHIVMILLVAGYALRVGYMLYTPASVRQHDTYSKNFNGHEAYAWTLFETGELPTKNDYQFYHPPLNAIVQSVFMRIMDGVSSLFGGSNFVDLFAYGKPSYVDNQRYFLYSSCQILSVLYSFVTAVTLVKMLKLFNLGEKTYLFLAAFVVFFPRHIQFAGMLNNDAIAYMLSVLALYFALKWWKGSKSPAYIWLCGLAVGLGMMAKLSSATICLPIAGIFIYEFIRTLLKKEGALKLWKMVVQYGVFLCICAPIGLWFQVYASMRFDQPLGFVFSNLNKKLYTGHHSIWGRFGISFDISEYLGSLYCRPFEGNYNLFNYALKSSIFGEFSYSQGDSWGAVSVLFAYMGIAFLVIGAIWCVVLWWKGRKDEDSFLRKNSPVSHQDVLFVGLLVASQVLSEIYFYVKMPYGCTMDFRYIMPLIFGLALSVGLIQKILIASNGERAVKFCTIFYIIVGAFLVSATLFYTVCS
ncbi:MAG: hypothetical protein J6S04_02410 [Clostridia bacterium]|nr:hypothetical protein [Clostridia bacterium]